MGCVDESPRLQDRVLCAWVVRGSVIAAVENVSRQCPGSGRQGEGNILGNSGRQHNIGGSVGPGDGQRIVRHGTAPCEASPSDIVGCNNLQNCVKDIVGWYRIGNGNAEGDATVGVVRGEVEARHAISVWRRVGLKLSFGWRAPELAIVSTKTDPASHLPRPRKAATPAAPRSSCIFITSRYCGKIRAIQCGQRRSGLATFHTGHGRPYI